MIDRRTKITPEIESEIVRMRKNGSAIEQIAESLHIGVSTVHRYTIKHKMRYRIDGIQSEDSEAIFNGISDGYSVKTLSSMLGFSQSSIARFLNKNNVEKVGKKFSTGLTKDQEAKIKDYVLLGYGRDKISNLLNIKLSLVRSFCSNFKIKNVNNKYSCKNYKTIFNSDFIAKILYLKDQGYSSLQIENELNIDRAIIAMFMRNNNTPFIRHPKLTEEEQIKLDQLNKLRRNVSKAIHRVLRERKSTVKNDSMSDYLPYKVSELKKHIEDQFEWWMTWENWGVYSPKLWRDDDVSTWVWHLDHIVPCSEFIYQDMKHDNFKECWALSNLRPLNAKQNVHDGAGKVRHTRPIYIK